MRQLGVIWGATQNPKLTHGAGPVSSLDDMRDRLRRWLFRLLGKDPEAVVVCLRSSDATFSDAMVAEIRKLEPGRRVFEAQPGESYVALRRRFRKYRIGLMPTLMPIPAAAC